MSIYRVGIAVMQWCVVAGCKVAAAPLLLNSAQARTAGVPEWRGFRVHTQGPSQKRRVSRPARRTRPEIGEVPRGCARAVTESTTFSPRVLESARLSCGVAPRAGNIPNSWTSPAGDRRNLSVPRRYGNARRETHRFPDAHLPLAKSLAIPMGFLATTRGKHPSG